MGTLGMLLAVADARDLASRTDNDFSAGPWKDAEQARQEIDACLPGLWEHSVATLLESLFLPAGPLKELALASGWGDAMSWVAARFESALSEPDCSCLSPPFPHDAFRTRSLGVDETAGRFAEVELVECQRCARTFLHYAFEIEGFSQSGRWYRAPVPLLHPEPSATKAPHILSLAPFHYVGGSYFRSTGSLQKRPFDPSTL